MADSRFCNGQFHEVRLFSLREYGRDFRVSKHFTLKEFACADGSDIVLIHPKLPALLESIRLEFGGPLFVNSAYRSHSHNANEGGAERSKHLHGYAADIWVPGVYPSDIAAYAEQEGAGGVGRYETFTHVDVYSANRRWSN